MTPLMIEILIHYYCRVDDFRDLDAPAVKDAIDYFLDNGLIKINTNTKYYGVYTGNQDALKVYIEALCNVPLPELKWVIPEVDK